MLRDVLAGQVPEVLRREMYALPALLGSALIVAAHHYDLISTAAIWGCVGLVFVIRMAAVILDVHAPKPLRTGEPDVTESAADHPLQPYDGILLLSFGGPERPEDVLPFLRTVTAGKNIPDERLQEVGEHYYRFGGKSPINDQNRALLAALRAELDRREIDTPLVWGNRNFTPFIDRGPAGGRQRGAMRRLVTIVTSAYSSYSSCRQYREDLAGALAQAEEEGLVVDVDKIRPYFNHPGFSRANARLVTEAVRGLLRDGLEPAGLRLVFVTHSIPTAMDETSGPGDSEGHLYSRQHVALGAAITEEVGATLDLDLEGELVFCSRSGPPTQPWLEPDVNDRLEELAAEGATAVVRRPDRLRLRPHGGHLRPRHRGSRDG